MPFYRSDAKELLDARRRVAEQLASVTLQWNSLRGRGADPAQIRALNTQIASLNERLMRLDAQLSKYESYGS